MSKPINCTTCDPPSHMATAHRSNTGPCACIYCPCPQFSPPIPPQFDWEETSDEQLPPVTDTDPDFDALIDEGYEVVDESHRSPQGSSTEDEELPAAG